MRLCSRRVLLLVSTAALALLATGCGGPRLGSEAYGPLGDEWLEITEPGWVLTRLGNASASQTPEIRVVFGRVGRMEGHTGAHEFTAEVARPYDDSRRMQISGIRTSRPISSEPSPRLLARERRFADAVSRVLTYSYDPEAKPPTISLRDSRAREVLRFEAREVPSDPGGRKQWWQYLGIERTILREKYR